MLKDILFFIFFKELNKRFLLNMFPYNFNLNIPFEAISMLFVSVYFPKSFKKSLYKFICNTTWNTIQKLVGNFYFAVVVGIPEDKNSQLQCSDRWRRSSSVTCAVINQTTWAATLDPTTDQPGYDFWQNALTPNLSNLHVFFLSPGVWEGLSYRRIKQTISFHLYKN